MNLHTAELYPYIRTIVVREPDDTWHFLYRSESDSTAKWTHNISERRLQNFNAQLHIDSEDKARFLLYLDTNIFTNEWMHVDSCGEYLLIEIKDKQFTCIPVVYRLPYTLPDFPTPGVQYNNLNPTFANCLYRLWYYTPKKLHAVVAVPQYVAHLLVGLALMHNDICPITSEPIEIEHAAVSTCYHVFDSCAIQQWMVENYTCPVCNRPMIVTVLKPYE